MQVVLHPAHAIAPLPGPAAPPGRPAVSVPFLVTRWGRRRVGSAQVILRDRWRLAEGSAELSLPRVDCYPRPATQRTRVVLSRLPTAAR